MVYETERNTLTCRAYVISTAGADTVAGSKFSPKLDTAPVRRVASSRGMKSENMSRHVLP